MQRQPLILLVDPFADEREMFEEFLGLCGFEVMTCQGAEEAFAVARTSPVACVVARIRLSGPVDGIELTRQFKRSGETSHLPVLLVTTHISPRVWHDARQAGPDDIVRLPCEPEELVARLRRLLP